MPITLLKAMVRNNSSKVPGPHSLAICTDSGSDECELCGNYFEDDEAAKSTRIKVPCGDPHCEPCAKMWRILSTPTCISCYANFTCPRRSRAQTNTSSPQLSVDAKEVVRPQSPWDSHVDFFLNFRDRHAAFHSASAHSDDEKIPDSGSVMREEDDGVTIVDEISDKTLLEALTLANNRVGTNFNIREIEAEMPRIILRNCTKLELAKMLTQCCFILRASESDDEGAGNEGSQQPHESDPDVIMSQPDDTTTAKARPHSCIQCKKTYQSAGHLRQHMVVHTSAGRTLHRTCPICGRVLANAASRRSHEKLHRETDGERQIRLGKVKLAREQSRPDQRGLTYKPRERSVTQDKSAGGMIR